MEKRDNETPAAAILAAQEAGKGPTASEAGAGQTEKQDAAAMLAAQEAGKGPTAHDGGAGQTEKQDAAAILTAQEAGKGPTAHDGGAGQTGEQDAAAAGRFCFVQRLRKLLLGALGFFPIYPYFIIFVLPFHGFSAKKRVRPLFRCAIAFVIIIALLAASIVLMLLGFEQNRTLFDYKLEIGSAQHYAANVETIAQVDEPIMEITSVLEKLNAIKENLGSMTNAECRAAYEQFVEEFKQEHNGSDTFSYPSQASDNGERYEITYREIFVSSDSSWSDSLFPYYLDKTIESWTNCLTASEDVKARITASNEDFEERFGGTVPTPEQAQERYDAYQSSHPLAQLSEIVLPVCTGVTGGTMFITAFVTFVYNCRAAGGDADLRRRVRKAAKKYEFIKGEDARLTFERNLRQFSARFDADRFYREISACEAEIAAALPELPYSDNREAKSVCAEIVARCCVLDGRGRAKELRKELRKLKKDKDYAQIKRYKDAYAARFETYAANLPTQDVPLECDGNSRFDGTTLQRFGWKLLCGFLGFFPISLITLGFSGCLAKILWQRFYTKHTVLDGRRLSFEGKVGALFVQNLKHAFLTVITLTIYRFFAPFDRTSWIAKKTHIAGQARELGGTFDGNAFVWFFLWLGCFLLSLVTLGIAVPFTRCAKERWRAKHTVYDGRRLVFDGRAAELAGRWIGWLLLSVVTLGIYYLFVSVRMTKWLTSHTHLQDGVCACL